MVYFIDIETKPRNEFIEVVKAKFPKKSPRFNGDYDQYIHKKMSVDLHYSKIVCVCILDEFGTVETITTVKHLEKWFKHNSRSQLVGFNSKAFDVPRIIECGIRHKLNLPYSILRSGLHPFRSEKHLDLMLEFSYHQRHQRKSLDELLKIFFNLEKNTKGDDFFYNATSEDLIKHCQEDIIYTKMLYDVFKEYS